MKISKEGVAITKRFFQAIDMLQMQHTIRGLQTFTREHGLNRWNMITLKESPDIRVLKPECLAYLVQDYDVSAEWLLTGVGPMFKGTKHLFTDSNNRTPKGDDSKPSV